jgi:hypothetical protein
LGKTKLNYGNRGSFRISALTGKMSSARPTHLWRRLSNLLEAFMLEGNGLKIPEDKGVLAVTKPSSENVYTLLSMPEIENKQVLGSDLPSEPVIRDKLQEEAETFFSSIPHVVADRHTGVVVFRVRTEILKSPSFRYSISVSLSRRRCIRGYVN